MKVLIIGGGGLVGPYVMQEINLSFPNPKISTITRSGRRYFTEHAFKTDRNNKNHIRSILKEVSPDYIIDMIPFTLEDAKCTSSLIKEANPNIPVIVLSSIDVYSAYAKLHRTEDVKYQSCPILEDMELRKELGVEGEKYDKLNVESVYQSVLENVTILRLPATYGWPDERRVDYYLDLMLDGNKVIEIPKEKAKWQFSRCLHKNAAYAVLKVMEAAQGGHHVYNVAEQTTYSELEWCEKIAKLCGWQGDVSMLGKQVEDIDFKQDFFVSSQKIRSEINFTEKYCPDEGLAEAVKFYAYGRLKAPYKPCY